MKNSTNQNAPTQQYKEREVLLFSYYLNHNHYSQRNLNVSENYFTKVYWRNWNWAVKAKKKKKAEHKLKSKSNKLLNES